MRISPTSGLLLPSHMALEVNRPRHESSTGPMLSLVRVLPGASVAGWALDLGS